jgi:sialic acid synthase SpsE
MAGADAVKFQTFTVEEVVTDAAAQAPYQAENTGRTESQALMLEKLALSHAEFAELKLFAEERGIEFISTPFSVADADFLESIRIAAFKISSGDLTNLPLLAHIAGFGKPVIISTGMATFAEVAEAFETLKKNGAPDVIILQCTSEYPTPLSHANLRVIETFLKSFPTPIGYSDHTEGISASVYAVSLGASVIEKHFTLDRSLPGPDHRASLEPSELKEMIVAIRVTKAGSLEVPEEALGSALKEPLPKEKEIAKLARKGIAARAHIMKGDILTEKNILIARPEGELLPKEWDTTLGKRALADIPKGTPLAASMIA